MRRRRAHRASGLRREVNWVNKNFPLEAQSLGDLLLFELVNREDYQESDVLGKRDHCTLMRTVGHFELDIAVVALDGFATLTWAAALIVVSEEAIANALGAGVIGDYSPIEDELNVRSRIIKHWGVNAFTNALVAGGTAAAGAGGIVTTGRFDLAWDVKQMVKMNGDDSLWLSILGTNALLETEWAALGYSRSLLKD